MKILLTAALAATTITTPGMATAHAAERRAPGYVKVTPNPALIQAGRSTWITVTVHIDTPRPLYQGGVLAELRSADGTGYDYVNLNGPDANGVATGRLKFSGILTTLGKWRVETSAITTDGGDQVEGPTGSLAIKAVTKLSATAKPSTVKKGNTTKIGGVLRTVDLGAWTGYAKQSVKIYYRKAKTKTWVYAGKAKTDAEGRYVKAFRPAKSGYWLVRWRGSSLRTASASKPVYVRVK